RVSLGFFSKNNMGELSAAATTDLSFMEMFAMNMVNTVVNGYITVIVLILFLTFYSPLAGGIALVGVLLSALFLHLLEARSHQNAPIHQKAQDDMVENSIEYLRGMQVVKAFKQEGVSIAGIRKAYNDSKKINIKIEVEYMPFNCLHLFSLKAASIAIVAVAAMMTYNGSMELPTMLMLDMFSFMIFG
ncbi:ABC transporter transmembrane domain-containing protein, partial [Clostridium sp. ATCC 29733]